jgi:hypothetical protein
MQAILFDLPGTLTNRRRREWKLIATPSRMFFITVLCISGSFFLAPVHAQSVASGMRRVAPAVLPVVGQVSTQTSASAQSGAGIYHDPYGRYSLTVPDGWTAEAQPNNGALQLSSGASWAMIVTGGGPNPREVNHQITQQIQAQFTGFQLLNEGDFQINGLDAHGSNATGMNPKGERVSVLVLSIRAGDQHYLSMISSAPNDQAKGVNATIMQIAQSIHFGRK